MDESRTVIEHDSGPFQSDAPSAPQVNWDVVDSSEAGETTGIDSFTMEIETGSGSLPEDSPFRVRIGSDNLLIKEHSNPGDNVQFTGNLGTGCGGPISYSPGDVIAVDFAAGTITVGGGSADCTFTSPLGPPQRIRYEAGTTGGSRVYPSGSYEVVLRGAPDLHDRDEYDPTDGTSAWPEVRQTVVFDFTYETPSMTYESTVETEEVNPDG